MKSIGKSRTPLALFVLLVFAGQSFAAVDLPCAWALSKAGTTEQQGNHHGSHQQRDETAQATACGCCDQHDCSMVQCISAPVAVAQIPALGSALMGHLVIREPPVFYAALDRDAPFRPPILR